MKLLDRFKKMNSGQKAEFIAASVLSAAFLVALPTYAWFASNKNLETITKIKQPGDIIIRAGKAIKETEADPIVNFEMKDIDIESIAGKDGTDGKPQRFVFSVSPGGYNRLPYDLQLAHTTNIPFTYKIYRAEKVGRSVVDAMTDEQKADLALYVPASAPDKSAYYTIVPYSNSNSKEIPMFALNENTEKLYGRTAKGDDAGDDYKCYSQTYKGSDDPDIYAVPIYMQSEFPIMPHTIVDEDTDDGFDYFILELGWDEAYSGASQGYIDWNKASNNKETDIIYITAKNSSG